MNSFKKHQKLHAPLDTETYSDYNPDHYRFRRTIEDFEPDASDGDKFVFAISFVIFVWIIGYLICDYLFFS